MTPLVDVAFLLLTFFMFATTMARPQALEMHLPPSLVPSVVAIPASRMLTLLARSDGRLLFRRGAEEALHGVDHNGARSLIADHYRIDGAVVALRIDTAARYQQLIDLLDDIRHGARSGARLNGGAYVEGNERFSIQPMTPLDYKEVGTL
jgi:biopolymer transport protein ExbD